jgi:hypothetical protein
VNSARLYRLLEARFLDSANDITDQLRADQSDYDAFISLLLKAFQTSRNGFFCGNILVVVAQEVKNCLMKLNLL